MISRNLKHSIYFAIAVGISIIILFTVIASCWIGYEIQTQCRTGRQQYGGDCIEALNSVVEDETADFRTRNNAIWALGQLGDTRALPILTKYRSGAIPDREPIDESISQYELSKALKLLKGGFNAFSWTWRWNIDLGEAQGVRTNVDTIIFSEEGDPYASLAAKISAEENIPVVHTMQDVQNSNPLTILMIAAPQNLSEEKIVNFGRYFKNEDSYPALGIITGSTIDIAENLYRRGQQISSTENYIGSDKDIKTGIDRPLIFREGSEPREEIPLTEQSLIDALQKADYFYWARHVSSTRWLWSSEEAEVGDEDCLTADEIPKMKAVIIHTPSCGSFHPWKEKSIALAFIDQGAAAYIGHVQSPFNSGMFIGHAKYLPGKYTTKDFPIGMMVQVQNHNTAKVAYDIPLFFMMGDPRMYLEDEAPYQILSDETLQDQRIIRATSDKTGVIPIRIENGASYSFVKIDGVSQISEQDPFNNTSIQTLDLRRDKYILFIHQGGEFQIELSKNAPLLWSLVDPLIDALDYSWAVIGLVLSPFSFVFFGILLLVVYFSVLRKKRNFRQYLPIFVFAMILALIQTLYILLRLNDYTVMNYRFDYGMREYLLGILGTISSISAGLILMKNARRKRGKIIGLLLSILPQTFLILFYAGYFSFINIAFFTSNVVPMILWNYSSIASLGIVLLIDALPVLVFDCLARRQLSA